MARLGDVQSGGQNTYVRRLSESLAHRGWHIDVLTHHSSNELPPLSHPARGVRVIRLDAGKRGFIPKEDLYQRLGTFLKQALEFLCKKGRYRVIHSNYWLSGWVGLKLRKHLKRPLVHTSHSLGWTKIKYTGRIGHEMSWRLPVEKAVVRTAEAVVATSPEEAETLRTHYRAPGKNLRLIPCGVDTGIFRPGKGHGEPEPYILFVGRPNPDKGLSTLIRAAGILKRREPDLPFKILVAGGTRPGDHAERGTYAGLVEDEGLTGRVSFLGPKSQEELADLYRGAAVCAVPSRYESFGLVALEALSCGCPVVASRVGGLKFVVRDGSDGFTAPREDLEAWAEKLGSLLKDPDLRLRMGRTARQRVEREFTWDGIAARMEKLYLDLDADYRQVYDAPSGN